MIPIPGTLNDLETAVWAVEFVRVRAQFGVPGGIPDSAIAAANQAVADLRAAAEWQR